MHARAGIYDETESRRPNLTATVKREKVKCTQNPGKSSVFTQMRQNITAAIDDEGYAVN